MTSQDTFEKSFRECLLDLVYHQWATLGAPFSDRSALHKSEVIDPEALLWCSLEFLPTEARLSEAVVEWTSLYPHYLVRQRIVKIRNRHDPRAVLWEALDPRGRAAEPDPLAPSEPPSSLPSSKEVAKSARRITQTRLQTRRDPVRSGRIPRGPATLLLHARDLLGHDIRHFLLIYLLANPHGGKLREIQAWSGYSYRSLLDAADRWKAADVLTLESGYCRLSAPEPFRQLLQIGSSTPVLVKWLLVFETCVRLLRDLDKARQKGFDPGHAITTSLKREAQEKLNQAAAGTVKASELSIRELLECFS